MFYLYRSVTAVTEVTKVKLEYDMSDDGVSSDESYLETDSPFVVHTKSKTR